MTEHGAGPGWLTPSVAVRLDGSERFAGVDATVADFWRWACSDLRENTTRGMLAEFLVAKAVGDQRPQNYRLRPDKPAEDEPSEGEPSERSLWQTLIRYRSSIEVPPVGRTPTVWGHPAGSGGS